MKILFNSKKIKSLKYKHFKVKYLGLPILLKEKSIDKTLIACCNSLLNNNIKSIASQVLGIYFILIEDELQKKQYIFTDNIGIMKLFYTDNFISDSFYLLKQKEKMGIKNIDKRGFIEFIRFGTVFNNKTYFEKIKVFDKNKILIIDENNHYSFINKNKIKFRKNNYSFESFFRIYSQSIKNHKISIDITGGIDSRLLATIFDYNNVQFIGFVSTNKNSKEYRIGKKITNMLKIKYYIHEHNIDKLEKKLKDSLIFSDGVYDIVKATRSIQVCELLEKKNINLSISGVGGELYKEFLYLQEFPFLFGKKININKLYELRFEAINASDNIFNDQYKKINRKLKMSIINDLYKYKKDNKIKTIDSIWYLFKIPSINGFNTSNIIKNYYNIAIPLLEIPLFSIAYNLPIIEKLFDRFHRKKTTFYNKKIARIITTQDISVSNEKTYLIFDLLLSILNKIKRLIRLFLRKTIGKVYFLDSPFHKDLYKELRKLQITKDCIEYFKRNNILSKNVTIENINNKYIGNLLTVYMLLKK